MIVASYPSKRAKATSPPSLPKATQPAVSQLPSVLGTMPKEERPTAADKSRALQFKVTPEEFVRRDKIVRQMWIDCQYRAGEVLRPINDDEFEKYGWLTLRGVFKSYHDFPTAEALDWPDDDRPFILTCSPEKGSDRLLVVTPQWVQRSLTC